MLVKGLPLAYNRDLQEDKERLFDSFDTVDACLELAAAVVAGAELNREAIAARLDRGYLDATTLMEHLIMQGVPQRTAHEIIGRLVATAMKRGVPLAELPLDEFQAAHAVARRHRVRRARRRPRRRSVHQLRLHQPRPSRTPTHHSGANASPTTPTSSRS